MGEYRKRREVVGRLYCLAGWRLVGGMDGSAQAQIIEHRNRTERCCLRRCGGWLHSRVEGWNWTREAGVGEK